MGRHGTDKIDIFNKTGKLSTVELTTACLILDKGHYNELDTDQARTKKKYQELEVMDKLFYNYQLPTDYEKMKGYLLDMINYYRYIWKEGKCVNRLCRFTYQDKFGYHTIICKPSKGLINSGVQTKCRTAGALYDHANMSQEQTPSAVKIPAAAIFFTRILRDKTNAEKERILLELKQDFVQEIEEQLVPVQAQLQRDQEAKQLSDDIASGKDRERQVNKHGVAENGN